MLSALATFALPPLLVFGLYHLLTWFNLFRVNARDFWKRVALASALGHFLLASGFFVFTYVEYGAYAQLAGNGMSFGTFLFERSEFWRLITIFDTAALVALLIILNALDRIGASAPALVALTMAVTYVVGTVQWYFVGGGIGAALARFWEGLKTGDDDDDEWFR